MIAMFIGDLRLARTGRWALAAAPGGGRGCGWSVAGWLTDAVLCDAWHTQVGAPLSACAMPRLCLHFGWVCGWGWHWLVAEPAVPPPSKAIQTLNTPSAPLAPLPPALPCPLPPPCSRGVWSEQQHRNVHPL